MNAWLVCVMQGRVAELVPKICKANSALTRKLHRFPTYHEIAEALEMNSSTVRLIMQRTSTAPISIDEAITPRGHASLQVFAFPKSSYSLLNIHQMENELIRELVISEHNTGARRPDTRRNGEETDYEDKDTEHP